MGKVSLSALATKVSLLVAVTSDRRFGKLATSVTSSPYLKILPDCVVLQPGPMFGPKMVSRLHREKYIALLTILPILKMTESSCTPLMFVGLLSYNFSVLRPFACQRQPL